MGYKFWSEKILTLWKNDGVEDKVVGVDLEYPSGKSNFWEKYKKMDRNTNLKKNELFGTYNFHSCKESSSSIGKVSHPVYHKILREGTEAYLYRGKYGADWQVTSLH